MSSIHGITCNFVQGTLPTAKHAVRTYVNPGLDGVGTQQLGKVEGDGKVVVFFFGTEVEVNAWSALIEARQGCIGTIINDRGVIRNNCFITRVSQRIEGPALPVYQFYGKHEIDSIVTR